MNYSQFDKFLHKIALGNPQVAELSFDIENLFYRSTTSSISPGEHVFIAGLARAGTTALMRIIHQTGLFRSLTYRDMPFVLAPNFWRMVYRSNSKSKAKHERMHGDGLENDYDSPEALEEVFWRTFYGAEYIKPDHLSNTPPQEDILDKFSGYIGRVTSKNGLRYLSKNNNNILRLSSIESAFPSALMLIPFRNPFQHASSLLHQHRRFIKIQKTDPFSLEYMCWLAHHEFGLGHRPFNFNQHGIPKGDPMDIEYWLNLWIQVYEHLSQSSLRTSIFICYEDLCVKKTYQESLWKKINLDKAPNNSFFQVPKPHTEPVLKTSTLKRAEEIYNYLRNTSVLNR